MSTFSKLVFTTSGLLKFSEKYNLTFLLVSDVIVTCYWPTSKAKEQKYIVVKMCNTHNNIIG